MATLVVAATITSTVVAAMATTATAAMPTTPTTIVVVVGVGVIRRRLGGRGCICLGCRSTGGKKSSFIGALDVSITRGLITQDQITCHDKSGESRKKI
jgi:hypothetical protein